MQTLLPEVVVCLVLLELERRHPLFKAWTEPKHIEQWWGPKGFTTRVKQMDFRPGGTWRYVMCGPDGTEYPGNSVFKEVVPPERIVASDQFIVSIDCDLVAHAIPESFHSDHH
ncbi:MAG: hypothetical protein F6K28_41705 [Microcoleus sp. SIO2G3]|nr:hypothetical protein [Microcoleus sp. SIO2G3]